MKIDKLNVTIIQPAEASSGAYAMVLMEIQEPIASMPIHTHAEFDETMLMLQGVMDMQIGQELQRLEAGDSCVIPRGTPHSGSTVGEGPWQLAVVVSPGIYVGVYPELARIDFSQADAMQQMLRVHERYSTSFEI